jgi:plasmid stabilization system protein ParE
VKFVVRWKQHALDDLAAIWLDAVSWDRRIITTAAREADRVLRRDPYGISESREGDLRIMFVAPLAVTFSIDDASDKVEVLRIRRFH